MKHLCKYCGKTKNIKDFDKVLAEGPLKPWNLRRCKACTHLEYEKRYANPSQRKTLLSASVDWKKRNPECHAKLAREYRKRHPEKIMAQNRLNYAVKMGRIKRLPCEICGTTKKVHAHHVSYEPKDWYNVRWLCFVCHEIEHG